MRLVNPTSSNKNKIKRKEKKMNKSELIAGVKAELNCTEECARNTIDSVVKVIKEGAKINGKAVIPGLGQITVSNVAEKSGESFGKPWTKPAHKKFNFEFSGTHEFLNS